MISVVIPCHASAGTLSELADRIAAALSRRKEGFELILVNDGSPSAKETWEVIQQLAKRYHWVHGIDVGQNVGPVRATLLGLRRARGELVITMDDDFQHAPEDIPYLLANLAAVPSADCVIGTYRDAGRSPRREFYDKCVHRVLRTMYGMPDNLQDTGFRLIKRDFALQLRKRTPWASLMAMMLDLKPKIIGASVERHKGSFEDERRSRWMLIKSFAGLLAPRLPFHRYRGKPLQGAVGRTLARHRRAMIVGVTGPQVDAIRYLKEQGWWVAGISALREGAGIELVDHYEQVDVEDVAAVIAVAKRLDVRLVHCAGSDPAQAVAAEAARELCQPFLFDADIVETMYDKCRLRDRLDAAGLGGVRYASVSKVSDLDRWHVFPAQLALADGRHRGVGVRCENREELLERVTSALERSPGRKLLVEECLEGPEISVNAFVVDGAVRFLAVADREELSGCVSALPRRHVMPTRRCSQTGVKAVEAFVAAAITELGIRKGPVYFRIKLTESGVRVVDAVPGLDDCHLWRVIEMVHGVDMLSASFEALFGENVDFVPAVADTAGMQLDYCIRHKDRLLTPMPERPMFAEKINGKSGAKRPECIAYGIAPQSRAIA